MAGVSCAKTDEWECSTTPLGEGYRQANEEYTDDVNSEYSSQGSLNSALLVDDSEDTASISFNNYQPTEAKKSSSSLNSMLLS